MPVLVLQPPSLPPLQTYIALSCLSLAWCFLYARETLETVENAGLTHQAPDSSKETLGDDGRGPSGGWSNGANESETSRYLFGIQADDGEIIKLCRIMMADVWSVLVSSSQVKSSGGFHKELRLVLFRLRTSYTSLLRTSLTFFISPRTSPKLGLVLTLCEIDPRPQNNQWHPQ